MITDQWPLWTSIFGLALAVAATAIFAAHIPVLARLTGAEPLEEELTVSYPQLLTPLEKLADAKERLGIPTIVCISGSTRFMTDMVEHELRETAAGRIVVKPGCNMKDQHPLWAVPADAEALKAKLDDLHLRKIDLADEVLVVGDYVGLSTCGEIAYARKLGKRVRFTHPEVDPDAQTGGAA